jgi:hypothetical protein
MKFYNRAARERPDYHAKEKKKTMGNYTRTLKDFDGEVSNVQVHVADLNAGNIAAQITLQSDFGAAINNLSLGSLQKIANGNQVDSNQPAPTNVWAQRELKWRVDFTDDVTGEPGFYTIPMANADLLSAIAKGEADLTDADVIAFVAASDAYVLSKQGNPTSVVRIVMVGRNI